ncbi:protein kinase domain-containing protein [Paenibacillus agaridevorans]|uniref:protein kinase domain-containing protein n=1 Tax=Paenibacillus agaridevorans TaxID=171404 RepID=UPI001BE45477|nr:hypothetical protein [Paenibacillus agaridevorans]
MLLQLRQRAPLEDGVWAYCSPERTGRMRRDEDARSSLYALGIIYYEMLTGSPPFQAQDPLGWIYLHLAQSPPPLREAVDGLPESLETIVLKLLDKNPDNRFATAESLIAALENACERTVPPLNSGTPGFYGRDAEAAQLESAFRSV